MRRRFINSANSVPLSFEALEDGFSLSFINDVLYSIDDGPWETLPANEYTEEINSGSVISFKHVTSLLSLGNVGFFNINKKCNVFGNCGSLIPKVLGEKHISDNLFYQLFYKCSGIVDASKLELPATTLTDFCYQAMFKGCTSLVTAPELPATTLANSCYSSMFSGCTALTTAPKLPATTLADYCYSSMFDGCSNLVNAPELPATTLANNCYSYMFYGCTKLNYIKMLATDISASDCLNRWVFGVSSTGKFVKNPAMTTLPTGTSGIPSGWTVVNDGEE